jgi:hypothetical protein
VSLWSSRALLNPVARYLALAVMAASFALPVQGLGIPLCWLHSTTGLPCPGCGMTRALTAFSHGDFTAALGLNPFVLLAWPTFFILAAATLAPKRTYQRFEAWVMARDRKVAGFYRLGVFAFIAFGVARLVVFAALGQRFP